MGISRFAEGRATRIFRKNVDGWGKVVNTVHLIEAIAEEIDRARKGKEELWWGLLDNKAFERIRRLSEEVDEVAPIGSRLVKFTVRGEYGGMVQEDSKTYSLEQITQVRDGVVEAMANELRGMRESMS